MDNIETGKGGLNVFLKKICNLQTMEVSKAFFGTKCLNIFASGCSPELKFIRIITFSSIQMFLAALF